MTAVSGLALATAPDVTHYLSFLQPLANHNDLATGLATTLAPAAAATLFIFIALGIVNCETAYSFTTLLIQPRVL